MNEYMENRGPIQLLKIGVYSFCYLKHVQNEICRTLKQDLRMPDFWTAYSKMPFSEE